MRNFKVDWKSPETIERPKGNFTKGEVQLWAYELNIQYNTLNFHIHSAGGKNEHHGHKNLNDLDENEDFAPLSKKLKTNTSTTNLSVNQFQELMGVDGSKIYLMNTFLDYTSFEISISPEGKNCSITFHQDLKKNKVQFKAILDKVLNRYNGLDIMDLYCAKPPTKPSFVVNHVFSEAVEEMKSCYKIDSMIILEFVKRRNRNEYQLVERSNSQ